MKGNLLSEEAGDEERKARETRIAAEQKLDSLRAHRRDLFLTVNRLSEEIMDLQRRRQSLNDEVQNWHSQFKALGDKQRALKDSRTRMMDHLDDLLDSLHQKKSAMPQGAPRHKSIASEIAQMEKEQQTKVMSLKDENALIDRIRQMRQKLAETEKVEAKWMEAEKAASAIKNDAEATKVKLAQANAEMDQLRAQRDEIMAKVKSHLGEIGHVLTEIRAKGQTRSELLQKVKDSGEEIADMGKKVLELSTESRKRIDEARRNYFEHGESVRKTFFAKEARERSADENLTNLLKNGKVELGFDNEVGKWANTHVSRRKGQSARS
jgi:uncharacterized coiled-coil DUF342 family protein